MNDKIPRPTGNLDTANPEEVAAYLNQPEIYEQEMANMEKHRIFRITAHRNYLLEQGLPDDQIRAEMLDIFGDEVFEVYPDMKELEIMEAEKRGERKAFIKLLAQHAIDLSLALRELNINTEEEKNHFLREVNNFHSLAHS